MTHSPPSSRALADGRHRHHPEEVQVGRPPDTRLSPGWGAFLLALVVGALGGLYPAMRAARQEPTEALRSA